MDENKLEALGDEALSAMKGVAQDAMEAVREANTEEKKEKRKDKRSMSRRGALVGVPAFLVGMMLWKPQRAYADTPWWGGYSRMFHRGNVYDWGFFDKIGAREGQSDNSYLFTDRTWIAKTEWVEWDINSSDNIWGATYRWDQYIATAAKLSCICDFSTELYFHITGKLEMACHSYYSNTGGNGSGWHRNSGDDNRIICRQWDSDSGSEYQVGDAKVCSLSNDPADGSYVKNLHREDWNGSTGKYMRFYTDYQEWDGGAPWSIWVRREPHDKGYSWRMLCWFWNFYYYNDMTGGPYYDRSGNPPIGYSTKWCDTKAKARSIDYGLAWQGRILQIAPAAAPSKRVDVGGGGTGNGATTCLWDAYERTNQNFEACLASNNDPSGCVALAPVHCAGNGRWIDQDGGGPTLARAANCQLYDGNGSRAQSLWIYDTDDPNVQHIFNDCSGYALDRADGKTDNGTSVRWHSDGRCDRDGGLDGKLSNKAHEWKVSDVFFRRRTEWQKDAEPFGLTGLNEDGAPVTNHEISVTDPASHCIPMKYKSSEKSLSYVYSWALLEDGDDGAWTEKLPEVMGRCHMQNIGWLKREMPGNNYIGAHIGTNLEALTLHLTDGSISGGIEYQLREVGKDWEKAWAADGAEAGKSGVSRKNDMFRCRLTGDIAEKCDVYYHINRTGAGWGLWDYKKNGEASGLAGSPIAAIIIRIQPKALPGKSFMDTSVPSRIVPTEDMATRRLACFVRCSSNGPWNLQYRGTVSAVSEVVTYDNVRIEYYVDGNSPENIVFRDQVKKGEPYTTKKEAVSVGEKPQCSGFYGWYTDEGCTNKWVDGTTPAGNVLKLYGRNKVEIDFKPSTHALTMMGGLALTNGDGNPGSITDMPPAWSGWYGDKVTIPAPADTTLYAMDAGKKRTYACTAGVYARDWDGNGTAPQLIAFGAYPVTSSGTRYYDWLDSPYDGFIGR